MTILAPGPRNLITDVHGLRVGNAIDERVGTGVTVLLCPGVWVGAVDVRGGGPGVRETETLAPENLVQGVHAIVLSGGSVFGLAAADQVTALLSARGVGLQLRPGGKHIPIVPSAVLHDLSGDGDKEWGVAPPYRALGEAALAAADDSFALGSIGAGRGARAGDRKGGLGSVSLDLGDGLIVGALAAVNSVGSAHMPDGRAFWAWPFEIGEEFGGIAPDITQRAADPAPFGTKLGQLDRLAPGANTTLVVVATSADLDKAEAKRIAIMAQDGLARSVRPAHTPFDGDLVFALASGAHTLGHGPDRQARIARLGSAAADCVARAIARGVYLAGGTASADIAV